MLRRKFISNLFYFLSSYLLIPQNLLAKLRLNIQTLQQSKVLRVVSKNYRIDSEIPIWYRWGHIYISVEDFAQAMHSGFYTNEQKRKTVLYLEKDRITFTANNGFVRLNDQMIQIPLECQWQRDRVWAPAEYFVKIINKYTVFQSGYNKSKQQIDVELSHVNITAVRIAPKENGTLIHINSNKRFDAKDIVLDIRNGYFHIDIYGGKIDKGSISAIPGAGIISKVEGFQLGETASIAFKLKKDIVAKELLLNQESNDFSVNLRTSATLAHDDEPEPVKNDLEEQKKRWMIDTVVLDAGHGGKDSGAIGYSKVFEKNIVLPITLRLGQLIQENMPEIKVVYTRKKDVFIPLWKRTKIANDVDANIFISVHCNSNKSRRINGFETYFLSADKEEKATDVVLKENSAIQFEESEDRERYEGLGPILAMLMHSANVKQSQYLASQVQNFLNSKLNKIGMSNRGVKQGPFWVLVGATMPNILIETGYLSNKHEEMLLKKSTTQKKIAEGIFNGLKKYKEDIENSI
jgi:N-acetylmuramoyl-L-alanine amidase